MVLHLYGYFGENFALNFGFGRVWLGCGEYVDFHVHKHIFILGREYVDASGEALDIHVGEQAGDR
jgi:hypothetical protein